MKKYLLGFCGGWMASSAIAGYVISKQDQKYEKLWKYAMLNFDVIRRFAAYSPPEISTQIKEEVEFDYLALRLDDVDSSKVK